MSHPVKLPAGSVCPVKENSVIGKGETRAVLDLQSGGQEEIKRQNKSPAGSRQYLL